MHSKPYDFIIIGAGISGLYAAFKLKKENYRVLVLEAASELGGTWKSVAYLNSLYELGPNTILSNSAELLELINELDLNEEVIYKPLKDSKRYIYHKDHLIELKANPLSLLNSGLISLKGLLRVLLEPFSKKAEHEEESVSEFFNRKFGEEITEVLVKTFLKGVWAGDIKKLSASVAFKDLVKLEKEEGSILLGLIKGILKKRKAKKSSILSFKKGLQSLCFKIAERLDNSVELNTKVISIEKSSDSYKIHTENGKEYQSESLVLATNAISAAKLCSASDKANSNLLEIASLLASIDYAPMALVALSIKKDKFKKDLDGFGFLSADDNKEVLGSIWSSQLFKERNLDDEYILLNFIGGALNREIKNLSEDEIRAKVLSELEFIYTDFSKAPLKADDFKTLALKIIPEAIPQLNIGHKLVLEKLKLLSENSGIYLVGNYLEGVSIKDSLKSVTEGFLAKGLPQKKEYH